MLPPAVRALRGRGPRGGESSESVGGSADVGVGAVGASADVWPRQPRDSALYAAMCIRLVTEEARASAEVGVGVAEVGLVGLVTVGALAPLGRGLVTVGARAASADVGVGVAEVGNKNVTVEAFSPLGRGNGGIGGKSSDATVAMRPKLLWNMMCGGG
jgi:hypothetical protein